MPQLRSIIFLFCLHHIGLAEAASACDAWPFWARLGCNQLHDTWTQGNNELYASGYAWHNRNYYDRNRIKTYNENAWGGGLGKSYYDKDGDWNGLFGIAFLDSHKNVQPTAGYAFLKVLHFSEQANIGAGYALIVTQRPDIFNGVPFPGALPWVSMSYRRASISATYIPGSRNVGNVLFVLAKWII